MLGGMPSSWAHLDHGCGAAVAQAAEPGPRAGGQQAQQAPEHGHCQLLQVRLLLCAQPRRSAGNKLCCGIPVWLLLCVRWQPCSHRLCSWLPVQGPDGPAACRTTSRQHACAAWRAAASEQPRPHRCRRAARAGRRPGSSCARGRPAGAPRQLPRQLPWRWRPAAAGRPWTRPARPRPAGAAPRVTPSTSATRLHRRAGDRCSAGGCPLACRLCSTAGAVNAVGMACPCCEGGLQLRVVPLEAHAGAPQCPATARLSLGIQPRAAK